MIDAVEFVDRLCRLGARRGPRRFPRKARDREILLKSLRLQIAPDGEYSEPEFNELLARWNRDIAPEIEIDVSSLRRLAVDYGEVERTRDGSRYRLGFPGRPVAFDLEIDELDLKATIAAYRMNDERERERRRKQHGSAN